MDDDGQQVRQNRFYNYWKRGLTRLGYPAVEGEWPRIHDFRQTHASMMLSGGFEVVELSRRLSHESIKATMDRYSHLIPDANFEGVSIAEKAFATKELPPTVEDVGEIVEVDEAASG